MGTWTIEIIAFIALFAGSLLKDVLGGLLYDFVPDNDDIFQDCPKRSNILGINDVVDLTQLTFVYDEGRVSISGNLTCMWEGIEPTDRLEIQMELYKFQLGGWQPTVFSLVIPDFCEHFLDEKSVVYRFWTSNILEEDRICLNNYGHVYHYVPSEINTTMEYPVNVEGRYKIVSWMMAFDEKNVKRSKSVCLEIPGTYYKIK